MAMKKPHREKLTHIRDARRTDEPPPASAGCDSAIDAMRQVNEANADNKRAARLEVVAFEAWKQHINAIDLSSEDDKSAELKRVATNSVTAAKAFVDALALAEAPKEGAPDLEPGKPAVPDLEPGKAAAARMPAATSGGKAGAPAPSKS